MNYWLVKSEPFKYSWEQFLKDKRTFWDGVRNYQARNNLRAMKKDDTVLFYHSNEGLAVVGIAKVVKESYQDPTTEDPQWSRLISHQSRPSRLCHSQRNEARQASAKHWPHSASTTIRDAAHQGGI